MHPSYMYIHVRECMYCFYTVLSIHFPSTSQYSMHCVSLCICACTCTYQLVCGMVLLLLSLDSMCVYVCSIHGYLLLQSEEFDVYINYAGNYMDAVTVLENLLNKNTEAVKYLKVSTA